MKLKSGEARRSGLPFVFLERQSWLPRLFVRRCLATPLAELAKLEAFPRVRLALRGDVVAPLALLACEGDRRSLVTSHCYSLRSCCRLSAVSRQCLMAES